MCARVFGAQVEFKLFGLVPGYVGLRGKVVPKEDSRGDTVRVLFEPTSLTIANVHLRIGTRGGGEREGGWVGGCGGLSLTARLCCTPSPAALEVLRMYLQLLPGQWQGPGAPRPSWPGATASQGLRDAAVHGHVGSCSVYLPC